MARIAFIGLGNMGLPMAANLVKARHAVVGFDMVKPLAGKLSALGGLASESIGAACKGADAVISMLPAGAHVREVYGAPDGVIPAAAAGTLLIDSSTIDVATAREGAGRAAGKGLAMLDAPVSGGRGQRGAEGPAHAHLHGGRQRTMRFCTRAEAFILEAMGEDHRCMPAARQRAGTPRSATT